MAGLLGMDDLNSLISSLGPSEDEKRAAQRQAALLAGIAALGARKGYVAQDLSRAGMLGIGNYNQQMRDSGEDKMRRIAVAQQMQQMLAQRQAAQAAQELQGKIGGAFTGTGPNLAAMGPGGPTPANATAIAPVPMAEQYLKAAQIAAQNGRPDLAEKYASLAEKGQPEYGQPIVGVEGGVPVFSQFSKRGDVKTHQGVMPPPKPNFLNLGGTTQVVDELRAQPGATYAHTPTVAERTGQGQLSLAQQRFDWEKTKAAEAAKVEGPTTKAAADLRKEVHALQPVKDWMTVQPVIQSAREAIKTNDPAADLNLIYAAAKIFDPQSVVRESETTMVMGTGSPAERFKGYWEYVKGGGRLTPEIRANLLQQIESRARGVEASYRATRNTYEGLARKQGIPIEDIFVEPFVKSEQKAGSTKLKRNPDGSYDYVPGG